MTLLGDHSAHLLWFPQSLGDPEQVPGDQVELSGGGLGQGQAGLLGEEH